MVQFRNIGLDLNSQILQYRCWITDGYPDYNAAHYNGPKSGPDPLANVVAYGITDDNFVADFNLPNPVSISTTKKELPNAFSSSQLAVIENNIYLFGGNDGYGNKIISSTLDNPTIWQDTGATLPDNLFGSQLAKIDGYLYLFGGNNGNPTDHIYSAPISNPLNWTDRGALLPHKVYHSQLSILDGYVYLYGGKNDGYMPLYNNILRAPISNPLSWTDTNQTLPDRLYASNVGIIDGYIYLFGGKTINNNNISTNNIYKASISNPTTWTIAGNLPYGISFGQFIIVGTRGYLFTYADTPVSETYILICDLHNPLVWYDFGYKVPGEITKSQIGIINDRLFLFGGSGNSVIFADNSIYKYSTSDPIAIAYGNTTRTLINAANPHDYFKILGFPPWKTTFGV